MSLIEEALRRLPDSNIPNPSRPDRAETQPARMRSSPGSASSQQPTRYEIPSTPIAANPKTVSLSLVAGILIAMAVAIFIGGLVWVAGTSGRRHSAQTAAKTLSEMSIPLGSAEKAPASKPSSVLNKSAAQTGGKHSLPFTLTGTVEGEGDPYAVINGTVVGKGEFVGNAVLVDVREGTATLRLADGNDVVLRVPR